MKFLNILVLFGAAATTALNVELERMHEKSTGRTALSVFDSEDGKLLAKTCGSYIDATVPIDFSNTDVNGDGNSTVCAKTYIVHSLGYVSGGHTCTKIYDGATALVDCEGFQ